MALVCYSKSGKVQLHFLETLLKTLGSRRSRGLPILSAVTISDVPHALPAHEPRLNGETVAGLVAMTRLKPRTWGLSYSLRLPEKLGGGLTLSASGYIGWNRFSAPNQRYPRPDPVSPREPGHFRVTCHLVCSFLPHGERVGATRLSRCFWATVRPQRDHYPATRAGLLKKFAIRRDTERYSSNP